MSFHVFQKNMFIFVREIKASLCIALLGSGSIGGFAGNVLRLSR